MISFEVKLHKSAGDYGVRKRAKQACKFAISAPKRHLNTGNQDRQWSSELAFASEGMTKVNGDNRENWC
jgi:hypothetical protein